MPPKREVTVQAVERAAAAEVGRPKAVEFAVVYVDPEARPSRDLVANFQEEGVSIRWICDYRELGQGGKRSTRRYHAIVIDLSSSSPEDFRVRIQEARSVDLSLPAIAIIPPLAGPVIRGLKAEGIVHHYLERPLDQDDLVRDTLRLIRASVEDEEQVGTGTMDQVPGLLAELRPKIEASDLFADIIDGPDQGGAVLPTFRGDPAAKVGVAHEYRSMRTDVTMQELPRTSEMLQNYVLEEHVATGGMAELFKARLRGAEGFARVVAIKRILPVRADDEDFVAMFIDEARLASSLDHPNIVRTLDFGKCKTSAGADTYFIALDFVDGKDLNWVLKRLRERGLCMPEPIITYIASKIAAALQYLHTRTFPDGTPMGLVHRDISPHNVMLSKQGEVVIVDFGVVKAASKINVTQDGNLKGKLVYMSPEQASGGELDGRSDLFSLGLVIHEALTMKRAYAAPKQGARADQQILKRAQAAAIPPVRTANPRVSDGMENLLARALQKKPVSRFPDAAAMEKALKAHLRTLPAVEESDVAEFLAAAMSKDLSKLKALIQAKYPEVMEYASQNALNHIARSLGGADAEAAKDPGMVENANPVPVRLPQPDKRVRARYFPWPWFWMATALVASAGLGVALWFILQGR